MLGSAKSIGRKIERDTGLVSLSGLRRSTLLLLADVTTFLLVVVASFFAGLAARWLLLDVVRYTELHHLDRIIYMYLPALVILLWRSWTLGHYTQDRPVWVEVFDNLKTVCVIAAFDAFVLFVMGVLFSRLWFGFFLLGLAVFVPIGRYVARAMMIRFHMWFRPTFIVGVGDNAQRAYRAIASDASLGYKIRGFIDLDDHDDSHDELKNLPVMRELPAMASGRKAQQDHCLIFAFDTLEELTAHEGQIDQYLTANANVSVVPPPMGLPLYNAEVVGIFRHDTTLLRFQNNINNAWAQLTKRITDVLIGSLVLAGFLPLFLVLALFIRRDGGPVLYAHRRIGRDGKEFRCYKFRSMVVDSDKHLARYLSASSERRREWERARKLKSDPRITQIGHYLRRTSVDELPQLWNVVRGDMSLIGPRPITADELSAYGEYQRFYLGMTPGMTGLWQVSGRNELSYRQRVKLDVWYARNWSLLTDIAILVQTFKTLVQRHGAY